MRYLQLINWRVFAARAPENASYLVLEPSWETQQATRLLLGQGSVIRPVCRLSILTLDEYILTLDDIAAYL